MGLKSLKSVGHNLAHSYLSMMNYLDGNFVVEHIFNIAKDTNKTNITIDVINMKIEPEAYNIPVLRLSLNYLRKQFVQLLESEKLTLEHINSIYIFIDFDLSKTSVSKTAPNLELPSYNCNVEITDFNYKNYKASVVEWWRY